MGNCCHPSALILPSMAAQVQQQPDFDQTAHHLTSFTEHFRRCANLPAIEQGNRIEQALQRFEAQLERFDSRMEVHFRRNETLHMNSQARLENSQLFRMPGEPLAPLRSLQNHLPIAEFPANAAAIDRLPNAQVVALLRHLEVPPPEGPVDRRRAALKRAFVKLVNLSLMETILIF